MPNAGLGAVVDRLRRGAARADADGQLLARFVASRDEAAFAELVRRHGPTVFAVCRRVLGDHHLAEDAFQAVFVVLAKKAHTVRPREAVGGWLFGVARKAALEAFAVSRRRSRETPVAAVPDRPAKESTDPPDAAVLALLDAEIAALSEPLRAAVVLCELEGVPRKDAAARLGVPEGTLSSRLAAARRQLAERLRRRGVALPAALAATAAVPADLAAKAIAVAVSGAVPCGVQAITRGVMGAMYAGKLKLVAAGALMTLAVAGLATPAHQPAVSSPKVVPGRRAAPAPKAVRPGVILFTRDGRPRFIDPDGRNERSVGIADPAAEDFVLSPDGRRLAYWVGDSTVRVCALGDTKPVAEFKLPAAGRWKWMCWSPDGTALAVSVMEHQPDIRRPGQATHWRLTIGTGGRTELPLPANHVLTDWSPDGRHFLTSASLAGNPVPWSIHLMNRDGTPHKSLTHEDRRAGMGRLSSDGKRLLFQEWTSKPVKLVVADVGDPASARPIGGVPAGRVLMQARWSPDGRRIAYAWAYRNPADKDEVEQGLTLADSDGANPKDILLEKVRQNSTLNLVDWR